MNIPAEITTLILDYVGPLYAADAALVCCEWQIIIDSLAAVWSKPLIGRNDKWQRKYELLRGPDEDTESLAATNTSERSWGMFGPRMIRYHRAAPTFSEIVRMPLTPKWDWRTIIRRWMAIESPNQKLAIGHKYYSRHRDPPIKHHVYTLAMNLDSYIMGYVIQNMEVALIVLEEYVREFSEMTANNSSLDAPPHNVVTGDACHIYLLNTAKLRHVHYCVPQMERHDLEQRVIKVGSWLVYNRALKEVIDITDSLTREFIIVMSALRGCISEAKDNSLWRELISMTPISYPYSRAIVEQSLSAGDFT